MTEDEAKTKVCHKTLAAPAQPMRVPGGGDVYLTPEPRHCLGSACMAWRPIMGGTAKNIATGAERVLDNGGFYNVRDEEYTPHPVGGYCGLAGKP